MDKEIHREWEDLADMGICGDTARGAGGEIINVDSLEELDAVQSEFPMGPFSDQEVYPLVDLQGAMERMKQAIQAMAPPPRR